MIVIRKPICTDHNRNKKGCLHVAAFRYKRKSNILVKLPATAKKKTMMTAKATITITTATATAMTTMTARTTMMLTITATLAVNGQSHQ